jgi:hypothetical protein
VGRVAGDGWYAQLLEGVEPVHSGATGWRRGVALFAASVRAERLLVTRNDPGWRTLLLLRALLGRRPKLVVAHWIEHPGGRAPLERWAARRAVARAQLLTSFEQAPGGVLIPYARRRSRADTLPPLGDGPVWSGGRAHTDWETLRGAGLDDLHVVCTAADASRAPGVAHVDVAHDAFTAQLPGASCFVICLHEAGIAQGHVRVKDAIDAGVPIVATRVRALDGYLDDDSALLVAPGDPAALRAAVERLRGDRALADRLRRTAWERAGTWTWDDYLVAMADLARG